MNRRGFLKILGWSNRFIASQISNPRLPLIADSAPGAMILSIPGAPISAPTMYYQPTIPLHRLRFALINYCQIRGYKPAFRTVDPEVEGSSPFGLVNVKLCR